MIVQTIAALAVVVYFRKRSDPRLWSTLIAPGLGFLALLGFSIGALFNFTLVAGSEALYVRLMPWLLLLAVIGGVVYAAYLRSRKPEVYRGLDTDIERLDELDHEPVRA